MDITVVAPAYYSDMQPVRYLAKSAQRYDINIDWYGQGKPYLGWFDVQIIDLMEKLITVKTSHVLYTDSSDVIFLDNLNVIKVAYMQQGSPEILISHELSGACAGGILAEVDALYSALATLAFLEVDAPDSRNPQVRWRAAIEKKLFPVHQDLCSSIFQVADEPLMISRIGVYNPRTNYAPAILHFAGGYTDPVVGKAVQIDPVWEALGYAGF